MHHALLVLNAPAKEIYMIWAYLINTIKL